VKKKSVPITVTFRHIAPTDALRTYAEKKLKHVALLPGVVDAHVTLSANSHRHRQSAEIILYGSHSVLKAVEETDDLYAAIDLAVAKLDAQVRKTRGRVIEAPRRGSSAARRAGSSTAPA
jgi:putative sigma-54 modulation protein